MLKLEKLSFQDFLHPLHLRAPLLGEEEQHFSKACKEYLQNLEKSKTQNERNIVANALKPFLEKLGFSASADFKLPSQKGNNAIDLVLQDKEDNVRAFIEAKIPKSNEMINDHDANTKAMCEAILYYFQLRDKNNTLIGGYKLEHIIITDFYAFYIFKAKEFEKKFYSNKSLKNIYESFKKPETILEYTKEVYPEIKAILSNAKSCQQDLLDSTDLTLPCLFFDLRALESNLDSPHNYSHTPDSATLTLLAKTFSKDCLFNAFNPNDANILNRGFYNELLYILGLQDTSKNTKSKEKRILPSEESRAKLGTLYYNIASNLKEPERTKALQELDQGKLSEEVLQILIIWINRILFLKLLESSLVSFGSDPSLSFLNTAKIKDYTSLNELFFKILALPHKHRTSALKELHYLPYLNSSLFTLDRCELIEISSLSALHLPIYKHTQIKDQNAQPKKGESPWLAYLFEFLDAFDFGLTSLTDSKPYHKELINSSVLGLVFEELNGYKEGSFYTPSFITSYMCKQSLEKIVLDKFNQKHPEWNAKTLQDLESEIYRKIRKARGGSQSNEEIRETYRELLDSIKICDPAVGSGHFLVSALNEMIRIHFELGLFDFCDHLKVQNDEIYITQNGKHFTYKIPHQDSEAQHLIQKELFDLKKRIIKNNLFGVDINPNSVNIARLRLWIELLKSTYYKSFDTSTHHDLETLPNIDINIKCGNSLVSYFELEEHDGQGNPRHYTLAWLAQRSKDMSKNFKEQTRQYKELVETYKSALGDKARIEKQIQEIKEFFKSSLWNSSPISIRIKENLKKFVQIYGDDTFGFETAFEMEMIRIIKEGQKSGEVGWKFSPTLEQLEPNPIDKKGQDLFARIHKDYEELESLRNTESFEWRFEFPEILDEDGNFIGFDCVLGNPPYIRQEEIKHLKPHLQKHFKIYTGTSDIYTYFFEQGYKILCNNKVLSFITSNKWTRAGYGEALRDFLLKNVTLQTYIELNGIKVFENATVDTSILSLKKAKSQKDSTFIYAHPKDYDPKSNEYLEIDSLSTQMPQSALNIEGFTFSSPEVARIKEKIERVGTPLKDWDIKIYRGILTGYNDAFIIDSAKREEILHACADEAEKERTSELIKAILRGRDIKRYSYEWAGLWIIGTFPALKLDIEQYPALKAYLESFRPRINQSGEKGCRKKTSNKWFETQDNIAYHEEFAKEKIIYPNMASEFVAYLDKKNFFTNQKCFILSEAGDKSRLLYLTAILNSKANFWYFKQIGARLGASGYEMSKIFVERLPIPQNPDSKILEEIKNLASRIMESKKIDSQTSALESHLNSLIYQLYGLSDSEISLIETEFASTEDTHEIIENLYHLLDEFIHSHVDSNGQYEGKIIYSEIVQSPQFYLDKQGFFAEATSFILNGENLHYLLGMLNSKLIGFAFKNFYAGGGLGEKGYRYKKAFIERLPIPKLECVQEEKFIQAVKEILKSKKAGKDTQELESHLDSMIFDLYGLSELERQLVPRNLITLLLLSAVGSCAKDLVEILYPTYKNELQSALYSAKNLDSKPTQRLYQGKIVYPCIMAKEPCFVYEEQGFFAPAPANLITGQENTLKYLTGLLNSKLIYFAMCQFYMGGGIERELKTNNLLKIPIPKLDSQNQKIADVIIALVEQILESKAIDSKACTSALEARIDSLVYKLYDLSDSDIRLLNQA